MPAIPHRVRRFIRQHDLMPRDARVVCGLSGGSDSVALATVLVQLHDAGELRFVGIVHLNHRLRPTADRDEQFCRALAERLGRPILVEEADIAARAAAERCSVEVAAHRARYALYERALSHFDADVVALGHTRDDQAETFLLRLLRGAGPRGLAGIHPRRGDVVRPLLDCRRDELREWLAARREPFVEDESNADRRIPRNRIRAELIPRLAADFNPAIVDVLATEADLARAVSAWLDAELERFVTRPDELDVAQLERAPLALRRVAVWRAMNAASGGRPVSLAHVDAALDLLSASDGAGIDAPGHRVHRTGGRLVLKAGSAGSRDSNPSNLWRYPLSIPGEVALGDGTTISAELANGGSSAGLEPSAEMGNGATAAVRADLVHGALGVRNRRPGDRFRPVGLSGRKKLQDVFVDRKIARSARDVVPVVVDENDRIVWVAGHGIDEAFRVTDPSQKVVVLKLRLLARCS